MNLDLRQLVDSTAPEDLPALAGKLREAELLVEQKLRATASSGNGHGTTTELEEPLLLTYPEAAKSLAVSESYLETLVRQGKLRRVKLPAADKGGKPRDGRAVRLMASDLRALAEEHKS